MRALEDARRRTVELPCCPRRIVSLAPLLTELLFDLGVGERVVGVTQRCPQPAGRALPQVGYARHLDMARLAGLTPDLVLGLEEENRERDLEALWAAHLPLYLCAVESVEDGVALIGEIGDLADAAAIDMEALTQSVLASLEQARWLAASHDPLRLFCPLTRDPWRTVARATYGHDLLMLCGGTVVLDSARVASDRRYPRVDLEAICAAAPDVVVVPDEPQRFAPQDVAELARLMPQAAIVPIDGRLLRRIGRRTLLAPVLARSLADCSSR